MQKYTRGPIITLPIWLCALKPGHHTVDEIVAASENVDKVKYAIVYHHLITKKIDYIFDPKTGEKRYIWRGVLDYLKNTLSTFKVGL